MTREDILAELFLVKRTCRGAPLFAQTVRDQLTAQLAAVRTDSDRIALIGQISNLLNLFSALPADMSAPAIQAVIYSFKENCGHDFNAVISMYPFDGKSRDVACPSCGTVQHFQSPLAG